MNFFKNRINNLNNYIRIQQNSKLKAFKAILNTHKKFIKVKY